MLDDRPTPAQRVLVAACLTVAILHADDAAAHSLFVPSVSGPDIEWLVEDVSGAPVAGRAVRAWPRTGGLLLRCVTDEEGRCRTRGHTDGRWVATIDAWPDSKMNRPPLRSFDPIQRSVVDVIASGEPTPFGTSERPLLLRVPRSIRVAGLVVDERERPIGSAELHVRRSGADSFLGSAQTDGSGAFTFEAMPADDELVVEALARGFTGELIVRPSSAAPTPLKFKLRRALSIRGRVVDSSGEPNSQAMVDGLPVDADGRFAFGLRPGTRFLEIVAPGRTVTTLVLDPDADGELGLGTIELTPARPAPAPTPPPAPRARGPASEKRRENVGIADAERLGVQVAYLWDGEPPPEEDPPDGGRWSARAHMARARTKFRFRDIPGGFYTLETCLVDRCWRQGADIPATGEIELTPRLVGPGFPRRQ